MLHIIGVMDRTTPTVAVVHECQVLDEALQGEEWDTGCDFVVTNSRIIEVKEASKPVCGILWDRLQQNMLDDIEPLKELKDIESGKE
jgi:5-formyltetrahydrofolate cyclo-ligase